MTPVFLDTVGLIAIWNQTDQWHSAAITVSTDLVRRKAPLATSSFVLLECGNEAARRPYRPHVTALRQLLLASGGLLEPTAGDIDQAWADYDAGHFGSA